MLFYGFHSYVERNNNKNASVSNLKTEVPDGVISESPQQLEKVPIKSQVAQNQKIIRKVKYRKEIADFKNNTRNANSPERKIVGYKKWRKFADQDEDYNMELEFKKIYEKDPL